MAHKRKHHTAHHPGGKPSQNHVAGDHRDPAPGGNKHHKGHHAMSGHHDGHSGHDATAHDSHHGANEAHAMGEGLSPQGGYGTVGCEGSHLGCNEEHE